MPEAARLGDTVYGITSGEHNGHTPPHSASAFTGTISGDCSGNVIINGRPAAMVGSITTESDECCGTSQGSVAVGSTSVYINGRPAARLGDILSAHSGTGVVDSGSGNVIIGG